MIQSFQSRRHLLAAFAGAALALASGTVQAQGYPNKTIKLVVPFATGGTTSILGRLVGERMGAILGQAVIVENRAGAGGNIGMESVAKADPDGYTILMGPIGLAINPALYKAMPFDPLKDLVPVGLYCGVPNLLVVHPSVPANTLAEFIAYAKANPGKINYASNGNGTSSHLAAEMLKSSAGIQLNHVPYKGGGPAMQDLIGGHVSMLFDQVPAVLPQVRGGKVRALGVSSAKRSQAAPEIPAVAETIPGFDMTVWFGLMAPKGTPPEVVAKLNAALVQALGDPAFKTQLAGMSVEAMPGTPEEFGRFLRSETTRWAAIVKEAGAKID